MANEHINISIKKSASDELIDLRIPIKITVKKLLMEFSSIFEENWANNTVIKECNKGIILSDNDRIDAFPIANGDIFEIIRSEV